jgi:hypothetical protein
MKLFKKIPMIFEEKDYEIRVLYDDTMINVAVFLNNHPANGYRHQIILPKKCDVEGMLGKDAVTELVDISKDDIIEKRGEKLSKVIQENVASNL